VGDLVKRSVAEIVKLACPIVLRSLLFAYVHSVASTEATICVHVASFIMNSIMERWVQSCRHELLDRTLIWNEHHLGHAQREYEEFCNSHRAHQAKRQAAPLRPVPAPITDPDRITHLNVRRHDRLGGVLHEYLHAA
jgi:hypothetical protein